MSKYDAAAQATAEWWTNKVFGEEIARVSTDAEAKWHRDRGEHAAADYDATMTMLTSIAKANNPAPVEKREEYLQAVKEMVVEALEQQAELGWEEHRISLSLHDDYGPAYEFFEINERLGIPTIRYPHKTMTRTRVDHFVTSFGYQAPDRLTWASEDYDRPTCHSGKYTGPPEYDREPFKCSLPMYHEGDHLFDIPDPLCVVMRVGYDGVERRCNRPADDYDHVLMGSGGYVSPVAHEFERLLTITVTGGGDGGPTMREIHRQMDLAEAAEAVATIERLSPST